MRRKASSTNSACESLQEERMVDFNAKLKAAFLEVKEIQRGDKQGQTLTEFLGEL